MNHFLNKISKYSYILIIIYTMFFCLIAVLNFTFNYNILVYDVQIEDVWNFLIILFVSIVPIIIYTDFCNTHSLQIDKLNCKEFSLITLYSLLFAIPEEILFRGIIQGLLENVIESKLILITVSSLIFALAHLPNGAKGRNITKWNWELGLITFIIGFPLGIMYLLSESLLFPTLLHMIYLIIYKKFILRNFYINQ